MKRCLRTVVALCAAVLSVGVYSLPAQAGFDSPAVSVSAEAAFASLGAPKNIKTDMSRGTLNIKWSKVSGASSYRIDLKRGGDSEFTEYKTVKKSNVNIEGLIYGEKVQVRITPLKNTSTGYKKGSSATLKKTFKSERIYTTDSGLFVVDPSLFGINFATFKSRVGGEFVIEKCPWDEFEYWAFPATNNRETSGGYCVLIDSNNVVKQIFQDVPLDTYNDRMIETVEKYYGNTSDYRGEIDHDLSFAWLVRGNDKVYFNMSDTEQDEEGTVVLRQHYWLDK